MKEIKEKEIKTYGINYAGSKKKLLPNILKIIPDDVKTIFDGFSGTTRVSQALKQFNYNVDLNDLSTISKVFGNCFLNNKNSKEFYKPYINKLNNLEPQEGWFTKNYGGENINGKNVGKDNLKKPWLIKNTKKIDSIRNQIEIWYKNKEIDEIEKDTLLTSLLLASNKVMNALGHHTSYLKEWSKASLNNLLLEIPDFNLYEEKSVIYNDDIFNIIDKLDNYDLIYLDPPYGSGNIKAPSSRVRYQSYYHLWTTIILNDKPKLFGKSLRREDSKDTNSYSPFEDFRKDENGNFICINSIEKIINSLKNKTKYIILSYSTEGGGVDSMENMLKKYGKVESFFIDYKKHSMSSMKTHGKYAHDRELKEILFLIKF